MLNSQDSGLLFLNCDVMRTLILCNGEPSSGKLLDTFVSRCDYFVAADGAGNHALKMGFTPDVIIGDLDSYRPVKSFNGTVIRDSDQETNDLEKAMKLAVKKGASRIDILGATGNRLDHSLKNLSVLARFASQCDRLMMADDHLMTLVIPSGFSVDLPEGHMVSMFPLSGKAEGITTSGLKYPLRSETLENGKRDGSSNEASGGTVRITYARGVLLFMCAHTEALI